jgi:hypothetical protein
MAAAVELTSSLKTFDRQFDTTFENRDAQQLWDFLRAFPLALTEYSASDLKSCELLDNGYLLVFHSRKNDL